MFSVKEENTESNPTTFFDLEDTKIYSYTLLIKRKSCKFSKVHSGSCPGKNLRAVVVGDTLQTSTSSLDGIESVTLQKSKQSLCCSIS